MAYEDLLKDTSKPDPDDKDYFLLTITDLDPGKTYPIQLRWVYKNDKAKEDQEWSVIGNLFIPVETVNAPEFKTEDLTEEKGILQIKWSGKDLNGDNMQGVKQVNIWIKGGEYGNTYVKTAHFFTASGLKTIPVKSGTFYIKLQAESYSGTLSNFSTERSITTLKKPTAVSSVTGTWKKADGITKTDTFKVAFTFDTTFSDATNSNADVDYFDIRLTSGGKTRPFQGTVNRTSSSQVFYLSADKNKAEFNLFATSFTIDIRAKDTFGQYGADTTGIVSDTYTTPLDTPIISAVAEVYGYSISYNDQSGKPFDQIYIYENTGSGWSQIAQGTSNPVRVGTTNTTQRSVKAIFYDTNGGYTLESNTVTVTPLTSDTTDTTPPTTPTVTAGTATYTTIPITISTSDTGTKGFKVRYKKSGDSLYSTYDVTYTGASTTSTIVGLTPNSTYLIGVAAYDQANNLSSFSTDISKATLTQTVSTVTGLTISAISYGVLASWIDPVSPATPIYNYKAELYNSSNVLLETKYTFSTNVSFSGLKPSTTYYVKIYTVDTYGIVSSAVQSSNQSLNASGGSTDGLSPSSHPTPVVKSMFRALSVTWTPISNADKVTYHVHLGTTSTFTISSSTKAIETDGTFAVLKVDPATGSDLLFDTDYYIKIAAIDADTINPYASSSTASAAFKVSRVDNGDVAANAIVANNITAGAITSDKVTAGNLLVNKVFTVGGKSAVVTSATVSGGNIVYTTSGAHGFAALSLVNVTDLSPSNFNVSEVQISSTTTNTFTIVNSAGATGSTSAGSGTAVAVGSKAIKIDGSGDGINTPFKIYSGSSSNYKNPDAKFYLDSTGKFSIADKLYIDGSAGTPKLTVNGDIQAQSGHFNGAISVNGEFGAMKIGLNAGGSSNDGLYINANSYWYSNGNFAIGASSGSPAVSWNGTTFKVLGEINALSGSLSGNLFINSGGSLIASNQVATITSATVSGSNIVYTTSTAHGISAGQYITVSGLTPKEFNVAGVVTIATTSGTTITVANSTSASGSSTGTGTVGVGKININNSGIYVYDGANNLVTQMNTGVAGANTFSTTRAKIAKWTINDTQIYNNGLSLTAPDNEGTTTNKVSIIANRGAYYVGMQTPASTPSSSDIVLWAGQSADGSAAPFKVTADGSLTSSSGKIGGWTIGPDNLNNGSVSLNSTTGVINGPTINSGLFLSKTWNVANNLGIAITSNSSTPVNNDGESILFSYGNTLHSSITALRNSTSPNIQSLVIQAGTSTSFTDFTRKASITLIGSPASSATISYFAPSHTFTGTATFNSASYMYGDASFSGSSTTFSGSSTTFTGATTSFSNSTSTSFSSTLTLFSGAASFSGSAQFNGSTTFNSNVSYTGTGQSATGNLFRNISAITTTGYPANTTGGDGDIILVREA